MTDGPQGRPVSVALPGIVASLRSWGVVSGHWLPDKDGQPAVWLTTRSEIERVALQAAPWLSSQIALSMANAQVSYAAVKNMRVFFDSEEAQRELGDSLGEDEPS